MKDLISNTSLACQTLQGSKRIALACIAALPLSLAMAFDGMPPPPPNSGGGMVDPTVGTLPLGGPGAGDFDQTITLRGQTELLRAAVLDAGGDGFVEVIDIGDGTAWARFWGDVRVELSTAILPSVSVGLVGGFEGSGMHFAIGGEHGFGELRTLESGYELPLELGRAAAGGLLDSPLHLHAIHRSGVRTTTTFEVGIDGESVVIHQDI